MITNYPDRFNSVLLEDEFSSKFRLATLDDSPWGKHESKNGTLMNFSLQGREENMTDFGNEDELLYNCDQTCPLETTSADYNAKLQHSCAKLFL